MAYRRPAIEVIQEFQQAAAALALPSLPAIVVAPGFQIQDDVDAGVYSEENLAITSYSYVGVQAGSIVDLTDAPELEAEANAHKGVGVKLKDALLIKSPASPAVSVITGVLTAPNLFVDGTVGAFASFDPDADGAPLFYIDIIDGPSIASADQGRKLVIGKTDDNTLILAAEWQSTPLPLTSVEYRVLEYRAEEVYEEAEFGNNGITKTATSVDILPGLESGDTVPLRVVEGTVLLSWRALRPDLAGSLNAFTDLDSLEAIFGIGSIVPSNVAAYAINLALLNTTTEVNYTGLASDFFTNEENSFQSAFDFLESKDVYGLAVLTHNTAVHQAAKSHVEGMSLSSVGRERVCFFNRRILEIEVIAPASGLGTVLSEGVDNGLSGASNLSFKDPTNGNFITDEANVGHFLEITSYTPVEGVQRSVAPNERDFFSDTGTDHVRMGGAAFVDADNGKSLLVQGATTSSNDQVFGISGNPTSPITADVTPAPVAELMPSGARIWIADFSSTVVHDNADAVDQGTKLWTFVNGAFTAADIGRKMFVAGADDPLSNGIFTIASVASPTVIGTIEATGATGALGAGTLQDVYDVDREPARDAVSDSVDNLNRQWTILDALFTESDLGRKIRVTGSGVGNDGDYVIEAIISSTIARTTQVPAAAEEFNGFTIPTLSVLDIISVTPNAEEDAYIKETRHQIGAIISNSQLTLLTDPGLGFGGTLEDVVYRITKDMTLNEQAEFLAGYAASFASRRAVHTWPDILAVSVNALATKVPGYFAGAVLSGLTAGLPSQSGFTNLNVTGFVGRENSNDKFSDSQLDTIAGGGNMIFTQEIAGAALTVRHQLTTDLSTIYFQEFSVTKNVDLISRFFRDNYKPFIGIYNITDGLLDLLKTRGQSGIQFLKEQRAPRVGAPLRGGSLTRIEESAIQPDTVEIDISIAIPLPLNNIKLTLLV
jgi:hypothetical protein